MSSPLRLVSARPPARSSSAVHDAAAAVVSSAGQFATVRRRLEVATRAYPPSRRPTTLRLHPALTGRAADPERQGRQLADEALRRIDRTGHRLPQDDLPSLAEEVFAIDVAVVATKEWFDGAAWSEDGVKVAVVGTSPWPGRQRFALAHQLCHLLVDDEYGLHVDASIEEVPTERAASETRANAFAESFLMPEDLVRAAAPATWDATGFANLTAWLQLPARAVAGRAHRLGLITAQQRRRFEAMRGPEVAMLSGTTGRYAERCRRAARPRLPARLVRDAVRAGARSDLRRIG